jgi:hypothetical protein
MDPLDAFYQQLDSEQLLKTHGQTLVDDAREALAANPQMRVAGLITTADSPDGPAIREALAQMTGQVVPTTLLVGVVPRALVEPLLTRSVGTKPWLEQGWQPQQVLPIVVSTRDGHRFGFFGLNGAKGPPSQM